MKKILLIFVLLFSVKNINAININSVENVNKKYNVGYLDNIYGNSYLEMNFRSVNKYISNTQSNIYKYYPRIKKIGDYYILTYHGNKYKDSSTGGSIYYSISTDLINWSNPVAIWSAHAINDSNPDEKILFANCDFLPLNDGNILFFAIYHSKKYYNYDPYKSGVVSRIGKIVDGEIKWKCRNGNNYLDENNCGVNLDEIPSWETVQNSNIITGRIKWVCEEGINECGVSSYIHTGPTWEPHAFYDNNNNIVMTFSSGEPINKPSDDNFKHASGGVGTIVSKDGGITWSDAKFSAFKFIGNYDIIASHDNNKEKNVNYYTTQMAVTTQLNDGRYFSVYEMWSPSNQFGIPKNYSVSGSIFSKNYDFSTASNIRVSDIIKESLKANPSENDPRQQQSYSGDDKSLFTISNPAAAPYILQFPSGEVVVSFNHKSNSVNRQYLKLITSLNDVYVSSDDKSLLQTFEYGTWGSISLNDNHSLIASFPYTENNNKNVSYGIVYLNNTIMSDYSDKIIIDGNNDDWSNVDDALFVGSESQAQAIVRTTNSDKSINFLVEVLDEDLTDEDEFLLKFDVNGKTYSLILSKNKRQLLDENNNIIDINSFSSILKSDNSNKSGIVYEVSVDKNKIDSSNEIKLYLMLKNKDTDKDIVIDDIFNTDENDVSTWLSVKVVDKENIINDKDDVDKDDSKTNIDDSKTNIDDSKTDIDSIKGDSNIDNSIEVEVKEDNEVNVDNTLKNISILYYFISIILVFGGTILIAICKKSNSK